MSEVFLDSNFSHLDSVLERVMSAYSARAICGWELAQMDVCVFSDGALHRRFRRRSKDGGSGIDRDRAVSMAEISPNWRNHELFE